MNVNSTVRSLSLLVEEAALLISRLLEEKGSKKLPKEKLKDIQDKLFEYIKPFGSESVKKETKSFFYNVGKEEDKAKIPAHNMSKDEAEAWREAVFKAGIYSVIWQSHRSIWKDAKAYERERIKEELNGRWMIGATDYADGWNNAMRVIREAILREEI